MTLGKFLEKPYPCGNSPLRIIEEDTKDIFPEHTRFNNFHLLDRSRIPPRKPVFSATSAADKIRTINRRPPSFLSRVCELSFLCANCSARA